MASRTINLPGNSQSSGPDLLVAGAGPAGLACAIAAASQGLRVEVVDGRTPPIDKACGEGLMPDTLAALTQLGIDSRQLQQMGFPLRGISFIKYGTAIEGYFPEGLGLGIRRTALHQLLLERALALGVTFHWSTTVTAIAGDAVRTSRGTMQARWIAGADGPQSRVRSMAGLNRGSSSRRRLALRQHFAIAPWTDLVEVHWAKRAQAYVTPVSEASVCCVFIGSQRFGSSEQALALFSALKDRLGPASASGTPMGAVTLSRKLRRVTSGNIALAGDASGSVDAITGEGLALCFRQALALADALKAGDLALYENAHAHLLRLPRFMSRAMLLMDRHPLALARTFKSFERRPNLFPHLLKIHTGYEPFRLLGSGGLVASLLCMLTP
ncbi:MAG: FAD-dependent monooxygenase [Acidobacteria bacterium]|nr:FAD-dependent monooxygenase [Acidobacteriota bacterium]